MSIKITKFLSESNAIEGVYDAYSLDQALYAWEYVIKQDELSIGSILKTHKILMLNKPLQPNHIGYFRDCPVYIGGREVIHYSQIKEAIQNWIARTNLMIEYPGSRIEQDINKNHVDYERIHPFVDGNGRTGRIFLNWQRVKVGLEPLIIKESEKYDYYKWFSDLV